MVFHFSHSVLKNSLSLSIFSVLSPFIPYNLAGMTLVSLTTKTLVHSDQGCHYTSYSFIQILKDKNLRQSMSRKGNCWDNAPQESFFGHMKDEIDLSDCKTFEEVKNIIDDWMDYYNNDRYQWDLAKLSPSEYYKYVTTGEYPIKTGKSKNV